MQKKLHSYSFALRPQYQRYSFQIKMCMLRTLSPFQIGKVCCPDFIFMDFMMKKRKRNIFKNLHLFCQIALVEFKLINSQLIMAPLTKKELRITIANFYKLHHPKGKFFTYSNFKQPIKDKIITKKTHKNQKMCNRNGTLLHY